MDMKKKKRDIAECFTPLVAAIGKDDKKLGQWMFMSDWNEGELHLYAYKHCDTRDYIFLDYKGNFYKKYSNGVWKLDDKSSVLMEATNGEWEQYCILTQVKDSLLFPLKCLTYMYVNSPIRELTSK